LNLGWSVWVWRSSALTTWAFWLVRCPPGGAMMVSVEREGQWRVLASDVPMYIVPVSKM